MCAKSARKTTGVCVWRGRERDRGRVRERERERDRDRGRVRESSKGTLRRMNDSDSCDIERLTDI